MILVPGRGVVGMEREHVVWNGNVCGMEWEHVWYGTDSPPPIEYDDPHQRNDIEAHVDYSG